MDVPKLSLSCCVGAVLEKAVSPAMLGHVRVGQSLGSFWGLWDSCSGH